jgi:hypothetical protein
MSKMIQLRNVPERLHRERSDGQRPGQTLTAYIQEILEEKLPITQGRALPAERVSENPIYRRSDSPLVELPGIEPGSPNPAIGLLRA